MLETVQMVLQESLDHVQAQSETIEVRFQTEQAKLEEMEQARQVAATDASEVRAKFDAQEKTLNTAQEACENAKMDVLNAKKVKQDAIESRDSLLKEIKRFTAVHTKYGELLEDRCRVREQRCEDVQQTLTAIGTETSLVTSALNGLVKVRSSRSTFEEFSAKAVGQSFADHKAKLEQDLRDNTTLQEDGPIEAAEILHDAMLQNAASKLAALSDVREKLEKSETVFKGAKKEAKQQAQTLSSCQAERDTLHAKSVELAEVLDIVKRLILCTDAPSPGPTARGGATASPVDDEGADDAEDATEAALLLGNELINAASAADDTQMTEGTEAAAVDIAARDFELGDRVLVDGHRKGTLTWDGRPEYNFVEVKFEDDETCSGAISVNTVKFLAKASSDSNSSQDSHASVDPSNLQGAFDLADDKVVEEIQSQQGDERACDEPPAKKQKLESEAVVMEEAAEPAPGDTPTADADEAPAGVPPRGTLAKEATGAPVDIQTVMSSGGA